ncbi:hypothetical protein SNE40_001932 [Patella caerulea]|uniref:MYND-type domain-containing protein n=1 Tax=Patella caerulea TaxID=87958 RepID=A0AAN8K4W6_PATCE
MASKTKEKTRVTEEIELGFIEEADSNSLLSHQFPSKVGGLPAWLSLKPLPTLQQLKCLKCGDPTVFLLQVYAPRDEVEQAFHRTLFIFVCRNPSCCVSNTNSNFRVFRSQLPKINEFYSSQPPKEGVSNPDDHPHAGKLQPLCIICGAAGSKLCGRCHKTSYCSKQHQTIDWKSIHKTICKDSDNVSSPGEVNKPMCFKSPNVLFPEFDLVTEPENYTKTNEKDEQEKMNEYKEFLASEAARSLSEDLDEKELERTATKQSEDDDQFLKFKERIRHEQQQILRFNRGGEPLWISALNKPSEIPRCTCGAERQFEFQVLPQLLNDLNVDSLGVSIDWGVLCIYTCTNSCHIGNNYQEEYLWKQDIVKPD